MATHRHTYSCLEQVNGILVCKKQKEVGPATFRAYVHNTTARMFREREKEAKRRGVEPTSIGLHPESWNRPAPQTFQGKPVTYEWVQWTRDHRTVNLTHGFTTLDAAKRAAAAHAKTIPASHFIVVSEERIGGPQGPPLARFKGGSRGEARQAGERWDRSHIMKGGYRGRVFPKAGKTLLGGLPGPVTSGSFKTHQEASDWSAAMMDQPNADSFIVIREGKIS